MKKKITIVPEGGIGNRIHAIKAAAEFARRYKESLVIVWVNCKSCSFSDILDKIDYEDGLVVSVREMVNGNIRDLIRKLKFYEAFCAIIFRIWKLYITKFKNRKYVFVDRGDSFIISDEIRDAIGKKNTYFFSGHDFSEGKDYSGFKFKQSLVNKACDLITEINQVIGIHIRCGDHIEAIRLSPDYLFDSYIDNEIMNDESATFYLSSDSKEITERLTTKYGNRIITYREKEWERYSLKGQQDSIVELLCLSRCKKIYGSALSTFSELAAKIGGIQKIVVKKSNN